MKHIRWPLLCPSHIDSKWILFLICALCALLTGKIAALTPRAETTAKLPPFQIDPTLPDQIVLNPEQGLGRCHWVDPVILSYPYVSWAYDASMKVSGWRSIEPQSGVFYWGAIDADIEKARTLGKRIWLQVLTTEGATPQWAVDAGVQLIGSRGGTPVPWNETYQRLLRRVVHAMAARYDGNPTVEAIVIMAGGCYGEMTICDKAKDEAAWLAAGYTDAKFVEAVEQIIDIYLEEEHVWEDGSRTHGFLKTPVVLQLGAGLYGMEAARKPVVDYAMAKYGMRVWLKFNGLGGPGKVDELYAMYNTTTRVGYEAAATTDLLNRPDYYIRMALDHHSSYLCLQSAYFDIADAKWQEARELAARYLGAQIVIKSIEAPSVVVAGQEYVFATEWVNRGTVPLMRARRVGIRDIPVSYEIQVALVERTTNLTVFTYNFMPSVPTTNWYSAQPVRIEQPIPIPDSIPPGEYDLRIALVNVAQPEDSGWHYFRLLNTELADGTGRYTAGRITVLSNGTPVPTGIPTSTRTITPTRTVTPTPICTPTSTRTATPTPSPTTELWQSTIVLQQGQNGYTGTEDTYIYLYDTGNNYCTDSLLRVGQRQQLATLLRFDLALIPANALVTEARLELYAVGWSGYDMTMEAFAVLRNVKHCEATWSQASHGNRWGQAGCNEPGTDRRGMAESNVQTQGVGRWYGFDLTAVVRSWLEGSLTNNGVLLRGTSALSNNAFYFASAQHNNLALRPKLIVTYRVTGSPTPTPRTSPTPTLTPLVTPTSTTAGSITKTPTATPTPSPPPLGTEMTMILQQGVNGYLGYEDTYIHIWNPDTNYCSLNTFRVGYRQQYAALLHFDLSPIPANALVMEAYLELYAVGWSGSDMAIDAYGILRHMDVCQATWNQTSAGNQWGAPGCNDTVSDRPTTPDASVTTQGVCKWHQFRLTALVQDWISGRQANNGILLRGASSSSSNIFYFASAQHESVALHPRLVITYRLAANPTPTVSFSPTGTPTRSPSPTLPANPTATPTGSPTPTQTPSATRTGTVPSTLSPTATPTCTATPGFTLTPGGIETTVTLQQGNNGYTGCQDTYLYMQEPDANYCTLNTWRVGYRQQYTAWLHFDLSPIPANAIVTQASLQVYAVAWGGADIPLEVFRVLRKANACEATWNQAEADTAWGLPGANHTQTDRAAMPESNGTTWGIQKWYTFDVTMLVQDWLNGHFANYGLLLRGASPTATGIFYFASAERESLDIRPKLVITYRLLGTPTPFLTPRPTPVPSGTPKVLTLQQGNNGYTGCQDTYLYMQEPDANYCTLNTWRVGYRQQYTAWLHFDLSPIPANAIVTQASLQVYAVAWGGADIPLEVFRVLRKANACEATWNQAEADTAWGLPGANHTQTDRAAMPESNGTTWGIQKWYTFDVTMLVQDWLNGHFANYGLLLRGASPTATGIFYFASAERESLDIRPKLVITYFDPAP